MEINKDDKYHNIIMQKYKNKWGRVHWLCGGERNTWNTAWQWIQLRNEGVPQKCETMLTKNTIMSKNYSSTKLRIAESLQLQRANWNLSRDHNGQKIGVLERGLEREQRRSMI